VNRDKLSEIAIVGAGLFGRTLTLALLRKGYRVTLFDKDTVEGKESCAFAGAGMLAPYCELETGAAIINRLGIDAVSLWADIIGHLNTDVFLQNNGTIVVSHPTDHSLLQQFYARVRRKLVDQSSQLEWLDTARLANLEPSLLPRFSQALYAIDEGQIDNRQLMKALANTLMELGCEWRANSPVHHIQPVTISNRKYAICVDAARYNFDLVIDCRGMGAKNQLQELRGVRGEMLEVYAPDVVLNRPVRLLHPRYPIYIVPRPGHRFLIGATSIESEDYRPITVISTLELLSAAYSIDPSFAQASIVESRVNCRPALNNNQPLIQFSSEMNYNKGLNQPNNNGLIKVNGLYRHGFLVTPKLVSLLLDFIESNYIDPRFTCLFREERHVATVC
jgi:glycine oxidase